MILILNFYISDMLEISIKAEQVFNIGSYIITNSLFLSFVVLLVLAGLAYCLRKKMKEVPGLFQNIVESCLEALLTLMDSILGDRKKSEKYLPLIATIFIFILVSNWMGLLPGVGSLLIRQDGKTVPLFRSPAADLNFTLTLAIMSVIVTNFLGITVLGFFGHVKKYFNFSNPINFFVGLLELVSEISKMISFSFRLFGNIFAGEVLLTIVFFLVPYVVPIPFMFVELFFGAIQAFIFSILTLVFLSVHVAGHEH